MGSGSPRIPPRSSRTRRTSRHTLRVPTSSAALHITGLDKSHSCFKNTGRLPKCPRGFVREKGSLAAEHVEHTDIFDGEFSSESSDDDAKKEEKAEAGLYQSQTSGSACDAGTAPLRAYLSLPRSFGHVHDVQELGSHCMRTGWRVAREREPHTFLNVTEQLGDNASRYWPGSRVKAHPAPEALRM